MQNLFISVLDSVPNFDLVAVITGKYVYSQVTDWPKQSPITRPWTHTHSYTLIILRYTNWRVAGLSRVPNYTDQIINYFYTISFNTICMHLLTPNLTYHVFIEASHFQMPKWTENVIHSSTFIWFWYKK